jgi:hypothetical protein
MMTSQDMEQARFAGKAGNLIEAVLKKMWPTMTVITALHPGRTKLKSGQQSFLSQEVNRTEKGGGSLNPAWVSWIMGFPLKWTLLAIK